MISNYIRRLYYGLFFITPLIMNSHTSEIFEFNKMLTVYFFTIFIFGLWLIEQILHKNQVHRPRFLIFLFIFLMTQILSTFFSIDRHTSLYGYYGRFNGGLLSIIAYTVLFFVSLQVFDKKTFIKILYISLLSSSIVLIWGLSGKIGYDLSCLIFTGQLTNACWTEQFQPAVRMFSTLGQPNWLGAYLAIHFFIALYFIFSENTPKKYLSLFLCRIYLVVNFACILFTRSRSSLVAVAIGFIFFTGLSLLTKKISLQSLQKKGNIALALSLLLIVIICKTGISYVDKYLNFSIPTHTSLRVSSPPDTVPQPVGVTDSFDIRKIVWKGAIALGQKYPLLGTGVETFAYAYYFTRPIEHNYTSEWDFLYNKAHNEYLNYFATTGYLGLISYLILIGATFYFYLRIILNTKNNSDEVLLSLALLSAYITILVTNFFGFSTSTISLFFYVIPAIPFLMEKKNSSSVRLQNKLSWWKYGLIGIVALGIFVLSSKVVNYLRADVLYAQANHSLSSGEYQPALSLLDDALKLKYEHVYEDRLSVVLANLAYIASDKKDKKIQETLIRLSQGYNSKSLLASPKNVLYWKTRAKNEYLLYQSTNDKKYLAKASQALDIAQNLAPTDPKLPYSQALFSSSLSEIDRAIKLKTDFRDAYFLKGQILKQAGETTKAKEVFTFMLKKFDPKDEEVRSELKEL